MRNRFLSLILCFFCFYQVKSQNFYDLSIVQKIELHFSDANWNYQLDTIKIGTDGYILADWVSVNGVRLDSVGVKYKGNSSYDSSYKKKSLHIELNTFKDQLFQGYSDIKLGNAYADPSMIREVMAYNILNNYMDCPKSNFAEVYINGKYFGIYSNSENINKKFCNDRFYSSNNTFIKCNPMIAPGPTVKSNLKFISLDSSDYFNYYELKSKRGWWEFMNFCDTVTNFPSRLNAVLDIDKAIWMLAFNNLVLNLDSYNGAFAQNYYLYKDNTNHFNPIIWDLNMAFGGFPYAGGPNNSMGTLSLSNMQQLSPFYHESHQDWPLINAILGNPAYKRMLIAHIRTLIKENFSNNSYIALATQLQNLIDSKVQSDSFKFYTYLQFKNSMSSNVNIGSYSVPGISTLLDARTVYLNSTSDFTQVAPIISNLKTNYANPATLTLTAKVTNCNLDGVYLGYKFDITQNFEKQTMFDDGKHGDGIAGDGIFGTILYLTVPNVSFYIYAENSNAGMFSPERAEFELYKYNVPLDSINKGDLVINEFLAKNDKNDINEYGVYSDWLELYNTTDDTLNLTSYHLTDNISNREKFTFALNTKINPKSYLIVWADGLASTTKYVHANFSLSSNGGYIILSTPTGKMLDSLIYSTQLSDISTGRCPNGTGNFTEITTPTFKESNNFFCKVTSLHESPILEKVQVFPNPAHAFADVHCHDNQIASVSLYNSLGQRINTTKFSEGNARIFTNEFPNGIYFLVLNTKTGFSVNIGKLAILN